MVFGYYKTCNRRKWSNNVEGNVFNGISYSKAKGDIGYLYNANRDDNLAMSLQMYLLGEAYYPGCYGIFILMHIVTVCI